MAIPVVDLFAGPGGLSEGFAAVRNQGGRRCFRIALSVEKDPHAHRTLELRAFFRAFNDAVPEDYYSYLRGQIGREELLARHQREAEMAERQAWLAELGSPMLSLTAIDGRISSSLDAHDLWVLIGGPPCQAYSIVGRSRMRNVDPERFERDARHLLYREYLRILAVHSPPVFIMENVKGLLSAKLNGGSLFTRILTDLQDPVDSITESEKPVSSKRRPVYRLYSLRQPSWSLSDPSAFVIRMKSHGIPQDRHRVIILGVRDDLKLTPDLLEVSNEFISLNQVIGDLPKIRSKLPTREDSDAAWSDVIGKIPAGIWFNNDAVDPRVKREMLSCIAEMDASLPTGGRFIASRVGPESLSGWFVDEKMQGVCNHTSRSHMRADIERYFFASCFGRVHGRSPLLRDFPQSLLPKHDNVRHAIDGRGLFSDRFRVQLRDVPATTITSHISKDGHYFIHYDPRQCRSLTVREAARIQTFPDNYYFEGPQTSQYQQIGNAVPPLLARSVARIVRDLLMKTAVDNETICTDDHSA